jgi:hypothetical protein
LSDLQLVDALLAKLAQRGIARAFRKLVTVSVHQEPVVVIQRLREAE